MARRIVVLVISIMSLTTPAFATPVPDPCTLPIQPHWCEA